VNRKNKKEITIEDILQTGQCLNEKREKVTNIKDILTVKSIVISNGNYCFRGKEIRKMPDCILEFENLEFLDLSFNGFREIEFGY
jgi:hypothetical protein